MRVEIGIKTGTRSWEEKLNAKAEEITKKKYADLSLEDRVDVIDAIKTDRGTRGEAQKEFSQVRAVQLANDASKELREKLPKQIVSLLEDNGLSVTAGEAAITVRGVAIPLLQKEKDFYQQRLVKNYTERLTDFVGEKEVSKSALKRQLELARSTSLREVKQEYNETK